MNAFGPVDEDAGPITHLVAYLTAYAERYGTYPSRLSEYKTQENHR